MAEASVQAAHDHLLSQGVVHEASICALCNSGISPQRAKEEANVADELKYSETQHQTLLSAALQRETSALEAARSELETQKAELQTQVAALEADKAELASQIDVLNAEKAQLEQARDAAVQEFEEFKQGLDDLVQAQEKLGDRVTRLKAAAPSLGEDYFADDSRQARWMGMTDEAFEALIEGMTETAKQGPHKFNKADDGERCSACGQQESAFLHKAAERAGTTTEAARQTAAFSGGTSPTSDTSGVSKSRQFLAARGKLPAAFATQSES